MSYSSSISSLQNANMISLISSLSSSSISPALPKDSTVRATNLVLCGYCSRGISKTLRCGRCEATYYCSQACQKKDWKDHKIFCGSSDTRQRLPDLPIEVIERIIKYTLLRRTRLTPSSDPFHLNGTTSLLCVSRAFRELCLPSFYHSITITRPSHYLTFFEVKTGLFVAGQKEGWKERWDMVKEVSIVVGVELPLKDARQDSMMSHNGGPQVLESRYSKAAWPFHEGHLKVVCLLNARSPLPIPDPTFDRLLLADIHQDVRREECGLLLEQEYFASGSSLGSDGWTKATFKRDVMDEISERIRRHTTSVILDERDHFFSVFTRYNEAQSFVVSTDALLYHDLGLQDPFTFFHKDVELHCSASEPPSSDALARMVCDFAVPVRPTTIKLVGFGSDLLAPFEVAMRDLVEERELWFEDWRVVWEKEDENLVELPAVDSTGHVEPPKTERRKEQDAPRLIRLS